ncbi:hypothetical protein ACWCPQ_07525 [Nocardia sp. NPDC001965]
MSTEFDICAEIAGGLAGRAGAWEFVADFAACWVSPLSESDGCSGAELAAAEERLGLRFPAAVREAYSLFGHRPDLTGNQDELLAPDRLDLDEAAQMLIFRTEAQGVWEWGVALADPAQADPPVAVRLSEEDDGHWSVWLDRFSVACVETVLSEALFAAPHISEPLDADGLDLVDRIYPRLPVPEYRLFADDPGFRWFAGPDVVLRVDPADCLLARARTPEAFDLLRRTVPEAWISTADFACPAW